jgi:lipopolysaccharide export system protein LptC
VELVDNVKVTRQAFDGRGEMQISTEKLVILPKQDIVKTDAPVVITQAPKTLIHATGMIYDKKHQTVQLLKRVKVHYERPSGLTIKKLSHKPQAKPVAVVSPNGSSAKTAKISNNKQSSKRQTIRMKSRSKK